MVPGTPIEATGSDHADPHTGPERITVCVARMAAIVHAIPRHPGQGQRRRGWDLACRNRCLLFAEGFQWVSQARAQGWHERCGDADAEQCGPCGSEGDRIQRADIEEKR